MEEKKEKGGKQKNANAKCIFIIIEPQASKRNERRYIPFTADSMTGKMRSQACKI